MQLIKYPTWHYLQAPKEILKAWLNILKFNWYFFSIWLLVKTLLRPWKGDKVKRGRGFDPKELAQVLFMNLLSRMIGMMLRIIVICLGLFLQIILFILGPVFLLFWLMLPIIIVIGVFYSIILINATSIIQEDIVMYLVLGFLLLLVILSLRAFYRANAEYKLNRINKNPKSWKDFNNKKCLKFFVARTGRDLSIRAIHKSPFNKYLFNNHLKPEDVLNIINWYVRTQSTKILRRKFWNYNNLLRLGSIGHDWSYAYTPYLDKFSINITDQIEKHGLRLRLISREDEIQKMEQVLSQAKDNNALLIGEPGIGRETIVQGFASLVLYGKTIPSLCRKRVLELDINSLTAGASNNQEIQARLKQALDQAVKAGNIILVIREIHNFVSADNGIGKIDISEILSPYLKHDNLNFIATTTPQGFYTKIKNNQAILNSFKNVEVNEPNTEETILILQDIAHALERKSKTHLIYQSLKTIVLKTNQYIQNIPQPEKAISVLDQAFALADSKHAKVVQAKHINTIISQKAKVPVGTLQDKEKEMLLNLENILHKTVINQELAISSISHAMRRSRAGISKTKKPIGTFLFLGPTGVGKTQTAKALAQTYFGHENKMLRFDMSEFQNQDSVDRLINQLAKSIEQIPFSLILLDEIEKAHPDILNLFLQVLDDGRLTSSKGKTVSFRNAIIILTSNAGAETIRQKIIQGHDLEKSKNQIIDELLSENKFRPEFLNRFDGVILFRTLSREHIKQIAELMLKGLAKRLAQKDIMFVISDNLVKKVAELGYEPQFGARPMQRVIQDRIESKLAEKMLSGEIKRGDRVEFRVEDI